MFSVFKNKLYRGKNKNLYCCPGPQSFKYVISHEYTLKILLLFQVFRNKTILKHIIHAKKIALFVVPITSWQKYYNKILQI